MDPCNRTFKVSMEKPILSKNLMMKYMLSLILQLRSKIVENIRIRVIIFLIVY